METRKDVSSATLQKKKYLEGDILLGHYFSFCPEFSIKDNDFK